MPLNLAGAYESTWKRIQEQTANRAKLAIKVIGWIAHAERRLTVEELRHALAVEETSNIDEENLTAIKIILQICHGLLYIDTNEGTINMIHLTAYEYFQQLKDQFSRIHVEIAKTCMLYLGFPPMCNGPCSDAEALRVRLRSMPLLRYAAEHWGRHVHYVEQELSSEIIPFLNNGNVRASSFQALQYREVESSKLAAALFVSLPSQLEPLHIAAYWNLGIIGNIFLKKGTQPDILDAQKWTPLHWACSCGSETMITTLLKYGANIDAHDLSG